ncbi:MAG: hypothetical protein KJN62_07840 [Deltaproteobacteria bacterium]|nr:hypothetical protein [Deltaproteobacteria bacterium]
MGQIIEVAVSYGKTINMGNYESSRIDIELRAKVLEGEDSNEVVEDLRSMAKLKVNQAAQAELKKLSAEEYF